MRLLLVVAAVLLLAAAGAWALTSADDPPRSGAAAPAATPTPAPTRTSAPSRPVRASRCPAELARCRSVRGRVVFVESVDPDGDGDLHVVLAGGGVTGPGITSVDIAPALRPRRDPRIGDQVSAAGQVQRGSFGQSQVHAVELHVRRASG